MIGKHVKEPWVVDQAESFQAKLKKTTEEKGHLIETCVRRGNKAGQKYLVQISTNPVSHVMGN